MTKTPKNKTVLLVANGDLRQSANEVCWPAQRAMEEKLAAAVASLGYKLVRAHAYKPAQKHGFISSQKEGMAVFAGLDHRFQKRQEVVIGLDLHRLGFALAHHQVHRATEADGLKIGAPRRGERVAKYNRLLEIEAGL
jgi:hypothetical protein